MTEQQKDSHAQQPSGWKLVPLKPTEEMIEAGRDNNATQWNEGTDRGFPSDVANDVYVSMVRAAPEHLTPAEGEPVTELDFMNWFITAGCTGMSVAQTAAAILQKFDVRTK